MTAAKARADRLFSQLVRARAACEECGSIRELEAAHGISRRFVRVRWDLRNGFCLCAWCHRYFTDRPAVWDRWLLARWGAALYHELWARARVTTTKVDVRAEARRLHALVKDAA